MSVRPVTRLARMEAQRWRALVAAGEAQYAAHQRYRPWPALTPSAALDEQRALMRRVSRETLLVIISGRARASDFPARVREDIARLFPTFVQGAA